MIKFDKPTNLDGAQLRQELLNANVKIGNTGTEVVIDEYGNFWLDISEVDKPKAEPIVAAHNGTIIAAEAKAQAKAALLERLGITQDEANLLLS